jgi:hypothetical protein
MAPILFIFAYSKNFLKYIEGGERTGVTFMSKHSPILFYSYVKIRRMLILCPETTPKSHLVQKKPYSAELAICFAKHEMNPTHSNN